VRWAPVRWAPVRWAPVRLVAVVLASLMAVVAACGTSGAAGTVEVSGSSTVEPITTWAAERYEDIEPDLRVNVDGPGTGDGFELFCAGDTDISNASRPIRAPEAEKCEANGIEFIELVVAVDGVAVVTNPANDAVSCLSLPDIYALVGAESQGMRNWADAQALAAELGSDTTFPNAPLDVTAPGEESGTFDSFVELALAGVGKERAAEGKVSSDAAKTTRPDYVSQASDNVIIQSIMGSPSSLGWVGFAFAEEAEGVKVLEIDGGEGCVAPSDATIASGTYPLSRPLFVYVNAEAAADPATAAFVDFYVDNLVEAAESVGYVALTADELAATAAVWESRTTGTVHED